MKVLMSSSYGFCGGVRSAVRKALEAASQAHAMGMPCYVSGSLVHSSAVSAMLSDAGIKQIDGPGGNPPGIVVIRTHGIGDGLRKAFIDGGFIIVDATCPVLLRNAELLRSSANPILIGDSGHSEIIGLLGCRDVPVIGSADDLCRLSPGIDYEAVIQTTLSAVTLESILAEAGRVGISIRCLNSICQASADRREALVQLALDSDAIAVVGDSASANSRELAELAKRLGKPSFLISSPEAVPSELLEYDTIGLTAGASAPDELIAAVKRFPSYLRILRQARESGRKNISATELAEELSLKPIQVRKDISSTGIEGKPRIGFVIDELITAINHALGWDNPTEALIVGCGNLGSAIAAYGGFDAYGLRIVAAFDKDPGKIGTRIGDITVYPMETINQYIKTHRVTIAVIAVPASQAQATADLLVGCGIRGIWNFAPKDLKIPSDVVLQRTDLATSFAVLSIKLRKKLAEEAGDDYSEYDI